MREGVTLVAACVAAFAAGAAGLALARSGDGWESTAVVRGASHDAPLESAQVARRALGAARVSGEGPEELLEHLSASREAAGPAAFTVEADEPGAARRLASAYARAWAAEAGGRAGPAGAAARERRGVARAALTGALIGLLVGLLLAFLRERLDVRRTSSRSVAAGLGIPQLGRVPEVPDGVEEAYQLPALEAPGGSAAGAYEQVAAKIAAAARATSARVVAVCGAVAGDRGEQVAAGLAAALVGDGRRVAVVELEPARPVLRRQFALARGPGAAEVARGEATLDEALAPVTGVTGLSVLTAGAGPPPGADGAEDLLAALARRFDLVVVAAPPLLPRAGSLPGVDALVLAIALRRTRHSRRPRLERALEHVDAPVLGFVLMASAGQAKAATGLSAARA
jgi:Mrp family chromosome partitioning ATPase